jgi:hypothetical protein
MRGSVKVLFVLCAGLLAACDRPGGGDRLPDLRLPTYAAQQGPSLAACAARTRKCLTVYVAPWCHYCRESTPMLIALRAYLGQRGVETRFVVGEAALESLRDYAQVFGPGTLLDVHNEMGVGGVPHFFVSDDKGFILKDIAGIPVGATDLPIAAVAAAFGLP